jgi:RNA polymerase sigma factor (sigma-70 family)
MAKDLGKKKPFISDIYDAFLSCESLLKRYIGRFLYKPEDIEDITQEAFLRAYRATGDRRIESPRAYLFRVAKTIALKELSKKSRQLTEYLEEATVSDVSQEASLEEEVEAEQKVRLFCDAIAELPPQCRRVFLMRKCQALSHKQVAEQLGITQSAVEKQLALGVERCKKYIKTREKGVMSEDKVSGITHSTSSNQIKAP